MLLPNRASALAFKAKKALKDNAAIGRMSPGQRQGRPIRRRKKGESGRQDGERDRVTQKRKRGHRRLCSPNQRLKLTGAAISVFRASLSLQAAPAA